jgi:hypothetical protein
LSGDSQAVIAQVAIAGSASMKTAKCSAATVSPWRVRALASRF